MNRRAREHSASPLRKRVWPGWLPPRWWARQPPAPAWHLAPPHPARRRTRWSHWQTPRKTWSPGPPSPPRRQSSSWSLQKCLSKQRNNFTFISDNRTLACDLFSAVAHSVVVKHWHLRILHYPLCSILETSQAASQHHIRNQGELVCCVLRPTSWCDEQTST